MDGTAKKISFKIGIGKPMNVYTVPIKAFPVADEVDDAPTEKEPEGAKRPVSASLHNYCRANLGEILKTTSPMSNLRKSRWTRSRKNEKDTQKSVYLTSLDQLQKKQQKTVDYSTTERNFEEEMHDHLQLYTQGTSDLSEGESSDPLFRNYSESTRFSLDAEDTVHIKHDKVADSVKSVLAASKAQKKSSESTLRTAEHLAIDYPGKVVHSIETFSTALRDQKKDLKGALIGSGGPPSFRNTMVSTAPVSSPKEIEEPSELREDEKFRVQKGQKENTENDESKANADKENSVNLLEAGGQEYIDLKDDKVEFEDDNGCDENEAIPDSDQLDKMNMPDSSGDESNDPLLRNHSESRRHSLDAEYSTPDSQDNVSDSAKTFLAVSKIQEKRNTFVVSTHSESPPKESLELLNSSDTEKEDNAEEVNPKESDDHKKAKNEDIIKVMEEMLFGTRHQKDTGLNTNKILETFSKMCEERQQEEVNDVLNSSFHSTDHDEEVPMDIDDSETSSADEDEVVSAAQSILLKTKKLEMPKKAKEPEHVLPDTSEIVSKSTNKREPVVNNPKVQHRFDPRLRRKASLDTPPVQPVVTPVRKQSAFASVLSAVSGASIHQLLPVATPSRPVQESVPSVGLSVSVNQRAHIYKQLSMSSVSVVHEMPKSILKTSTDIPEPSKTVLTFPAPRSTFSGHPSRPNLIQISMEPQVKLHKTAAGHKESFSENHFPTPVSSSALGQVHFPPLHEPATSPKKSAVRPIGKQDSDMFLFPPKQGSSEVEELNQNTTGTSVNLSSPPAVDPYRPELLKSCQRRIQHKSDHSPLRSPPPMKTAQVPASSVSRVISPLKLNSFMAPAAISPKKICPVKIVPKLRLRKDSKSIYRVSSDQLLTSTAVTSPKPQKAKTSNGALEPRSELKPLTSPDMVVLKLKEPFVIPRKNNSSLKLNPPKSVPELMAEDRKQAKSISKKPCKDLICPDLNSMSTVLTPLKPKPALESMSKPKLVLGPLTQDKDLYIPKKPSKEEQQNLKNSIFSDLDSLVIDTAQMRSPAALKLTTKEPATVMESPQPLQLVLPPISRAIGVKVSASKNPFLAEVSSNDNLFLRKCAPKKRTSEEDGSKAAEFLRRVQESRLIRPPEQPGYSGRGRPRKYPKSLVPDQGSRSWIPAANRRRPPCHINYVSNNYYGKSYDYYEEHGYFEEKSTQASDKSGLNAELESSLDNSVQDSEMSGDFQSSQDQTNDEETFDSPLSPLDPYTSAPINMEGHWQATPVQYSEMSDNEESHERRGPKTPEGSYCESDTQILEKTDSDDDRTSEAYRSTSSRSSRRSKSEECSSRSRSVSTEDFYMDKRRFTRTPEEFYVENSDHEKRARRRASKSRQRSVERDRFESAESRQESPVCTSSNRFETESSKQSDSEGSHESRKRSRRSISDRNRRYPSIDDSYDRHPYVCDRNRRDYSSDKSSEDERYARRCNSSPERSRRSHRRDSICDCYLSYKRRKRHTKTKRSRRRSYSESSSSDVQRSRKRSRRSRSSDLSSDDDRYARRSEPRRYLKRSKQSHRRACSSNSDSESSYERRKRHIKAKKSSRRSHYDFSSDHFESDSENRKKSKSVSKKRWPKKTSKRRKRRSTRAESREVVRSRAKRRLSFSDSDEELERKRRSRLPSVFGPQLSPALESDPVEEDSNKSSLERPDSEARTAISANSPKPNEQSRSPQRLPLSADLNHGLLTCAENGAELTSMPTADPTDNYKDPSAAPTGVSKSFVPSGAPVPTRSLNLFSGLLNGFGDSDGEIIYLSSDSEDEEPTVLYMRKGYETPIQKATSDSEKSQESEAEEDRQNETSKTGNDEGKGDKERAEDPKDEDDLSEVSSVTSEDENKEVNDESSTLTPENCENYKDSSSNQSFSSARTDFSEQGAEERSESPLCLRSENVVLEDSNDQEKHTDSLTVAVDVIKVDHIPNEIPPAPKERIPKKKMGRPLSGKYPPGYWTKLKEEREERVQERLRLGLPRRGKIPKQFN